VYTFFKANVAAIAASLLDYLVTFLSVQCLRTDPVVASVIGTLSGGILNFMMGRTWVFGARKQRMDGQMIRYMLVWMGSFVLNTAGVYLLIRGGGVQYLIAKISVSVLVGLTYNYLMQKRYVFIDH
jgi:putative flippase GtrA